MKGWIAMICISVLYFTNMLADVKPLIFVSILPQRTFVKKIVGDEFDVKVMVQPGHNPATYEPTPRQIMELSKAKVYFSIDVPFERIWLKKIKRSYPNLPIINTVDGIILQEVDDWQSIEQYLHEKDGTITHNHVPIEEHGHDHDHDHEHVGKDPHVWVSPELVKTLSQNILKEVSNIQPEQAERFNANYHTFINELSEKQIQIKEKLKGIKSNKILVFHPAWGYFTKEFGLMQIPIEIEGKEPKPKEMAAIITFCKAENVKTIFVQKQFSERIAQSIAEEIEGRVISLDPLAEDYLDNLDFIAETISEVLKGE